MPTSKHKSHVTPKVFITIGAFITAMTLNNSVAVADAVPFEVPPPLVQSTSNSDFNFDEIECLALNAYFEAGVEAYAGKLAVSNVVINRVNSSKFPDTICEVVKQGQYHAGSDTPKRYKCQFSWWCDGKADDPFEGQAWEDSKAVAIDVYASFWDNTHNALDITEGSMYYHADYVTPYWAKSMNRVVTIDTHIFYK
jgi:spore germination cell wall hydrolase CwlJ-like protein